MVSVRKRGKVYEYRFEVATIEGIRKWNNIIFLGETAYFLEIFDIYGKKMRLMV